MSEFEVKVRTIEVFPHPNADRLELAAIDGYRVVVAKGKYQTGEQVVYIPQGSVLPEWLIEELDLGSKLGGPEENRVRAVKLRGSLSQGLVYPLSPINSVTYQSEGEWREWFPAEDEDLQEVLGIKKYVPETSAAMNGEVRNSYGKVQKYDVDDIKRHMDYFTEGEKVWATEKIHGTQCTFTYDGVAQEFLVSSKGIADKGTSLKINEANKNNYYVAMFNQLKEKLERIRDGLYPTMTWHLFGEIYGDGVQDLKYDAEKGERLFAAFDMYFGEPHTGFFMPYDDFIGLMEDNDIETAPLLYHGAYSYDKMCELAEMDCYFALQPNQVREGVVVRPEEERETELGDRVIAKFVSERYLTRKGGTEFN